MEFHIARMSCDGCVATITDALKALDASTTLSADLAARNITVETPTPRAEVEKALADAGYPASNI